MFKLDFGTISDGISVSAMMAAMMMLTVLWLVMLLLLLLCMSRAYVSFSVALQTITLVQDIETVHPFAEGVHPTFAFALLTHDPIPWGAVARSVA